MLTVRFSMRLAARCRPDVKSGRVTQRPFIDLVDRFLRLKVRNYSAQQS